MGERVGVDEGKQDVRLQRGQHMLSPSVASEVCRPYNQKGSNICGLQVPPDVLVLIHIQSTHHLSVPSFAPLHLSSHLFPAHHPPVSAGL